VIDKADFLGWWLISVDTLKRMMSTMNSAYGNPMDLDDLFSEVFLRCWNGHLKDDSRGYRPWVWGVARNILCRELYRLRKSVEAMPKLYEPSECVGEERLISIERIANVIQNYQEQGRYTKYSYLTLALELTESSGDVPTHAEIAKRMGVSTQRVGRIMAKIKEDLIRAERSEDV